MIDAMSRRRMLRFGAAGAASVVLCQPRLAQALAPSPTPPRRLRFENLHTGEAASLDYWVDGRYVGEAIRRIDHLLRDHRTGEVRAMDKGLLDLLHRLRQTLGTEAPFQIISGYRSPRTNAMLASRSDGVARNSLHTDGLAVDIRVPGRTLREVRDAALSLKAGGVGFYARSDFVHVDIGRVRSW